MSPPNSSPAVFLPQSLPLREYETNNNQSSVPNWQQNVADLHEDIHAPFHQLAASGATTYKPTVAAQVVNWEHEFEKSQQRRAENDAMLKKLDKQLELKISLLKAETKARKEKIVAKILEEDRARLQELLARLDLLDDHAEKIVPGSDNQDMENTETAKKGKATISTDDDYKEKFERTAFGMETAPLYPYHGRFHHKKNASHHNDIDPRGNETVTTLLESIRQGRWSME
ncbi:hypothetical protein MMC07_008124 [Pseudocyphellaria aurata]|nr:hypothetical protein [Pseudocyphellaria aurata]